MAFLKIFQEIRFKSLFPGFHEAPVKTISTIKQRNNGTQQIVAARVGYNL